jgi:hypothetical protein
MLPIAWPLVVGLPNPSTSKLINVAFAGLMVAKNNELAARGKHVGYGTVWRFFAAEGISFKKNRARQRARAA